MSMILVKYFIPEDGDDEEHPNVFSIRVHNERIELNLRDVKKGFPLPGSYHFRFLTTIGAYTAWLDILNDEDIVPLYNGGYFCKVTRTINIPFRDSTASNSGASFIVKEKISPAVHNDHASPPRVVAKPAKSVPNPNLSFATSTAKPAPIPASAPAEKLLRFDDDGGDDDFSAFASSPAAATTAPSALLLEEDLLGMDTNATATSSFQSTAATPRAASSAVDLLGLDAIQPTPVATSAVAPMRPQRTAASTLSGSQSPIPPSRSNPAINVMGGMSSQNPAAQSNLRGMGMGMGNGSSGNLNSLAMGGGGVGRGSASMPMNGGRLGQGQGAYDPFNDLTGLNPSNSGATNRAAQQQQRR